ncbi:MAG: substrate-binding domain-containing protein [Pseudobutyrivibrio sp.]|nr:substrate-binding domain-containing protein [Pseudobutyrivibrio sp.]
MKLGGKIIKLQSSSALVIAAGCTVAFMFLTTIISFVFYHQRMQEANSLLKEAKYSQYDSYVVLISSSDKTDFWQNVYASARDYGREHGIYVDMISDNVDVNYSKAELLEMAIESGCDGILIEGDDDPEIAELLSKAYANHIPVITLEKDIATESRVSYVGVNNYTIANLYASSIKNNLVKQKNVMVVADNTHDDASLNAFVNSVQEAFSDEELPNGPLEFEIRKIENSGPFATEEYIQNLFQKNEVSPIVVCLDEVSTESFYQAMIDYNMVGQILLFGNYESQSIYTGIKQGVIKSTVTMNASSMGESAAKAFIEYRQTGHVSDYINVEPEIIDASNIDAYMEEAENGSN